MTVAHRQPDLGSAPPAPTAPTAPATPNASATRSPADLTIRWRIAADALAPGTRGTGTLELHARRDGAGSLRIEAAIVTPTDRRTVHTCGPLAPTAWWTDDTGLDHVDAGPTLRATLRRAPDGKIELLFAQTELFARLGIAGGRYDRPQ